MFNDPKKEDRLLFLLAFAFFAHVMDFVIMMPLGDSLMKKLDIQPNQFSYVVSIYSLMAAICGFINAMFMDKFDRKHVLMVTMTGFTLGTFWCGFANSYESLLIARGFTGAFGGVTGGVIMSIVSDVIPFQRRGRAMGIISGAFSIASIAGVPFGLFLATRLNDWHAPFIFFGIVSTISTITSWFMIPNVNGHVVEGEGYKSPFVLINGILSDKNQVNALSWTFFLIVGHFLIIPFLNPVFINNHGFPEQRIPLMYFIGGIASILPAVFIGKITDKMGAKRVYVLMVFLAAIPVLIITNVVHLSIGCIYFIMVAYFILGAGRMIPANTMVTSSVNQTTRGSFMSIRSVFIELGEGVAAFLGGQILVKTVDGKFQHFNWLGYLATAICIGTIVFAFRAIVVKEEIQNLE